MKTKEELNALKEEVEALNRKLRELTRNELAQVVGGAGNELPDGKVIINSSIDCSWQFFD